VTEPINYDWEAAWNKPAMVGMTPYKTGAPFYVQAGWTGIIPLPPKKKNAPPTGYTGWNGKDPSAQMIEMW
jgi:hypothetical protein